MDSRWKDRLIFVILKIIRLFLDFVSDAIFSIINYRKPEEIKPVTDPILLQPATSLAEKIRKRTLKSTDIIKAYISRIQEVNPVLNLVSEDRFKDALEDAKKADELIESQKYSEQELAELYPFLGVPFTNKESLAVEGMLNNAGLYISKDNRASKDADTVALMRKAGGIPLAITNVPELAMWWETFNNVYGVSRNPYDSRRIVGGSSGGEGALIATGGSVIGIGSDIGGSIRIPSFMNGIFGHKPSPGIVSNQGQLPNTGHLFDRFLSTGPICRYATDLLPMFKILAENNVSELKLDRKIDINKIKIYYMDEGGHPFCTPVTSEMKEAQRKVINYFEENYGIKSQKLSLHQMYHAEAIWSNNMATVPVAKFTTFMTGNGKDMNIILELFKWCLRSSKHTLPCIVYALFEQYSTYFNSNETKDKYVVMAAQLRKIFKETLDENGIFLYPSHPEPAVYIYQPIFKSHNFVYTAIFNILGLPVTQCPLGLSSKGLPLGVQVVAGPNNDLLTISVAEELERAFGGWKNPNL